MPQGDIAGGPRVHQGYFVGFARASPLSPTVVLKMGVDTPLHIGYLVEGAAEKGHLKFGVAPRIV